MKHLTEEDLVLLYYKEPGVPDEAVLHLQACAECRAAASNLALTLNSLHECTVPEPGVDFGRSAWAQLAPRLQEPPRRFRFAWHWLAPAMCCLLLIAFVAGRISKRVEPSITAGLSDTARQRILAITIADHLDRTELLLTEISNTGDSAPPDFVSTRGRAQDLVDEGRLLLQTLSHTGGETATTALLDEVERFMIEVANSPDHLSANEVSTLQRRIQSGSLLFKVRIIEANLRTKVQQS